MAHEVVRSVNQLPVAQLRLAIGEFCLAVIKIAQDKLYDWRNSQDKKNKKNRVDIILGRVPKRNSGGFSADD